VAIDTYTEVWNQVLLRCPSAGPSMAKNFIRNAFRRLYDRRRWSWKTKYGQFISPDAYSTGTVIVVQNLTTVTGIGTAWTAAMVGRQFRLGNNAPIYTIARYNSPSSIELDAPFGGISTTSTYEIYQCFFTVPSDFHQFITVWDPAFNWQLQCNVMQSEINIWDAQRASTGNVFVVSFRDYTRCMVGIVAQPLQVFGTGNDPTSGGIYTGPMDAIFTVEITTGGAPGTAVYQWKKDSGSYFTGIVTNNSATPQFLQDGVQVTFPTGVNYTLGDIFVIRCTAVSNPGLPRYELWPHAKSNHVYPFLYEMVPPDLNERNVTIPRYVRGDILMEMGLHEAAKWPGPSTDKPSPYFNLQIAKAHELRAEQMLNELELRDDEVWEQDLQYQYPALTWAFATPLGDAAWLQRHAI